MKTASKNAAKNGAKVIISNHDIPAARNLYQDAKIIHFAVVRQIIQNTVKELLAIYE